MSSVVDTLVRVRAGYLAGVSGFYDETLHVVVDAVEARGSVGKADIGALVLWKRMRADTRWATKLNDLPDEDVRGITAEAVEAARDLSMGVADAARRARSALIPLPGFRSGPALASAVLVAAAPDRMAVYDRRALLGLGRLGMPFKGGYGQYMQVIQTLLEELAAQDEHWTARTVDTALYWLGGPREATG